MNKILTYYLKTIDFEENGSEEIYEKLPKTLKDKIARLDARHRKNESLTAFFLIAKSLKLNGIDIYDHEYLLGDFGKPYLKDCHFCFSISHSKGLCVVSLSRNEVGVDVELVSDRSVKIDRLFTKKEKEYIENSKNRRFALYEIWTGKEAYLKESGKGLSIPLDSFEIIDTPCENLACFKIEENYVVSIYSKIPSQFEEPIEIKL